MADILEPDVIVTSHDTHTLYTHTHFIFTRIYRVALLR